MLKEDKDYPLVLSTGRNLFHYHYGSMTRRVKALESHAGKAYIELHPDDAAELMINSNASVKISSRTGSVIVPVRITERVRRGEVFMPMHYAEAAVNILTDEKALDYSKTPGYKFTRVRIEPLTREEK